MSDELVELDEAALVEQGQDALARGELAGFVLLGNPGRTSSEGGLGLHVFQQTKRIDGIVASGHECGVYSGVANVKGSALSSRVLWVQLNHGAAGMNRLLPQCSADLRATIERGVAKASWYPIEQFIELITHIDRVFGKGDLSLVRDLARHGADANLTTIYRLFYKVGTTQWILGRAVRLWSAHYDSGVLEVLTRGPKTAVLKIREFQAPHLVHCMSVMGWAERSVELSGGTKVKIQETKCRTRGDAWCQIESTWQ